jgi:hypothetical protein
MSATAYSRSTAPRSDKKFCGVCHKKGLPESVYTSHFTKSVPGDKGIVTCPTILNAVCRFCGMKGHWADEKFCSAMRAENKRNRRSEYRREYDQKVVVKEPVSSNRYAMLVEEEDTTVIAPASLASASLASASLAPAITVPAPITTPVAGVSWAAMAGRPAPIPKPVEKPLAEGFVVLGSGYKHTERTEYNWEEKEAVAREIFDARMLELEESEEWYDEDNYSDEEDNENW